MSFQSKSGCPMCSIVARTRASASSASEQSPTSPDSSSLISPSFSTFVSAAAVNSTSRPRGGGRAARADKARDTGDVGNDPEVVWHDENFTVYRERAHPVSSVAHFVIIFNLHVPSLYMLSTSDVPLLVQLRDLAYRLLADLTSSSPSTPSPTLVSPIYPFSSNTRSSPPSSPTSQTTTTTPESRISAPAVAPAQIRVGFITPPWKDTQIPVKDHLHAHAYVAPLDRCGWWRSVAYSSLAWYSVEDLVAEIREESSNNRIRSSSISAVPTSSSPSASTPMARPRPIDRVPNAGARSGTADGHETTCESLAGLTDLEAGRRSVRNSTGSSTGYSGYSYGDRGSGEGPSRTRSHSAIMPHSAARPAALSHLDLNAAYASSSGSSTPTSNTPAKASIGIASSSGELRPGSSLGPQGQLLSPAYTS